MKNNTDSLISPHYVLANIVTSIQCAGCNQALAPTKPLMVTSKDDAIGAAELLHSQSGIICAERKLIVIYQPCYVDAQLLKKMPLGEVEH